MTGLALGEAGIAFAWTGDVWAEDVIRASDYALASCAIDALGAIRYDSPYDTGSLQSSIHTAPPGYSADETAAYDRRTGAFAKGGFPTVEEVVGQIIDGHIWIGSWISYAYYMERGFQVHYKDGPDWRLKTIEGRYFIVPNAEAALRGNFRSNFLLHYARIREARAA